MKSVLLVNFDFPPNYGIGGRRWAKLSKGMARLGLSIDVIKADPISNVRISPWHIDTLSENIHVYSIPRPTLSKWISHPNQSLLGKIKYRIALKITQLIHRGTPYDISVGWGKRMVEKIAELHSIHHYKTIIATGAPWQMLCDLANFIQQHKELDLIVDFRDPWIESKNYGIQGLSEKSLAEEISKQINVLKTAKVVFSPCEYITENLKSFGVSRGATETKFVTLEHFFDPEDLVSGSISSQPKNNFTIIYAGEVYDGTSSILFEIIKDIKEINSQIAHKNKRIELEIYTDTKLDQAIFNDSSIRIHASIGKKIFEVISTSDACLILLPPHKKEEKTTKFFEYLAMKKPLLVASERGSTMNYVEENHLGFAWKNGQNFKWLECFLAEKPMRDDTFDITTHELQTRAQQVKDFLA